MYGTFLTGMNVASLTSIGGSYRTGADASQTQVSQVTVPTSQVAWADVEVWEDKIDVAVMALKHDRVLKVLNFAFNIGALPSSLHLGVPKLCCSLSYRKYYKIIC